MHQASLPIISHTGNTQESPCGTLNTEFKRWILQPCEPHIHILMVSRHSAAALNAALTHFREAYVWHLLSPLRSESTLVS